MKRNGSEAAGRAAWANIDLRALARTGAIHFVGIGGAGMSALADLILKAGGTVTGCDVAGGDVVERLRARGAVIRQGHDPAHVADAMAVVTTSAVRPDHPELAAARERGIPVLKRAEALGALVNEGTVIAVAGTHGKTSTTAMTAAILSEASLDPTAFVGGMLAEGETGFRGGSGSLFVVEADEYDRSFLTLRPSVAIVTSIEADHLDIYGSLEHIEEAFRELIRFVPADGLVAACVDDAGASRLLDGVTAAVVGYGTGEAATMRAIDVRAEGRTMRFELMEGSASLGALTIGVPGVHNVRNALGAIAAARHVGADVEAAKRALRAFTGVRRRFQELGTAASVTILDDYAHHPTEIAATIAAARAAYAGRRIVAAFQPHLYTRTRDFAREFGHALAEADAVWVTDVYPAREEPIEGVSGRVIVEAVREAGGKARFVDHLDALVNGLAGALGDDDVLVAMGAGDIDRAARELLGRLRRRESER